MGHERLSILFFKCWQQDPSERPDIDYFLSGIKAYKQPNDKSPSSPVPSKKKHDKVARKRSQTGTNGGVRFRKSARVAAQESWRRQSLTPGHINGATVNESKTLGSKGEERRACSPPLPYNLTPHNDAIVSRAYHYGDQSNRPLKYPSTTWQNQPFGLAASLYSVFATENQLDGGLIEESRNGTPSTLTNTDVDTFLSTRE
jgi:hypothetical protein